MTATIRAEYRETRRKLAVHRLAVQKALAVTYARLRRVQAILDDRPSPWKRDDVGNWYIPTKVMP